ncbi:MAG: hypothetical protein ACF8R7_04690 [Phycisphaerales bacterium JB039]
MMTDAFAASGSISADFRWSAIDIVHRFSGYTSGKVTWSVMTYVDSGADFRAFFIGLNEYPPTGGGAWSIQTEFRTDQTRVGSRPMVFDRWVEWRAEVDLDGDVFDLYYDDVAYEHGSWTAGISGIGFGYFDFAAIDLYMAEVFTPGFYIDDVIVKRSGTSPRATCGGGGCYADCDSSGVLDFFDFLCFQNLFGAGDLGADCDESGALDFFDFLCFQNEFAAGCP